MTVRIRREGLKNPIKIVANIFISFIGAGVLGLPYAFKESGIIEGIIIMTVVSAFSIKAMLLIIKCKYRVIENRKMHNLQNKYEGIKVKLKSCNSNELDTSKSQSANLLLSEKQDESDESEDSFGDISMDNTSDIGYGDVGYFALGCVGKWLVDIAVLVSQLGFCCAYLIFISENLASYVQQVSRSQWLVIILPPLFFLTLLRYLDRLAFFSFFAQLSNIFALTVVFWFDFDHIQTVKHRFQPKEISLKGFPFFFAVSIYCYEGAGMILALEGSLAAEKRPKFNKYFIGTLAVVTFLYITFGMCGYMSFGPETREIITLNLPKDSGINFAMVVKLCLCISLFFTYPVMMFPVTKLLEISLLTKSEKRHIHENVLRLLLVSLTGLVVVAVPNFANLMAFVGATCCTLLAFILPGLFHILVHKDSITRSQWIFDGWLIFLGLIGAIIGTSDAIHRMTATSPIHIVAKNTTNITLPL